jgi:ribosomal protein L37AE/L43A
MTTEDRRTRRLRELLEALETCKRDGMQPAKDANSPALWRERYEACRSAVIEAAYAAVLDTEGDRQEPEAPYCEKHGTMVARDESGSHWYCAVCGADTEGDPPTPCVPGSHHPDCLCYRRPDPPVQP